MGEYVLRLANASRERVVIPGDLSHAPSTEDLWAPPKVGDIAPGFSLSQLDSDDLVALSDFQGARPVVLVFGSFT
jgi:hypothetical protein